MWSKPTSMVPPASQFVAEFVGLTNRLEGTVSDGTIELVVSDHSPSPPELRDWP